MSIRSKFEKQLNFRQHGFSIKIPDVGRSLKPFDYVVGMPVSLGNVKMLRFVAIEAKTATGWSLHISKWQPHQRTALDLVDRLAKDSAWVAIGFLDIPKMKLDHNRQRIETKRKKEAYLILWGDYKQLECGSSCSYGDIVNKHGDCELSWGKVGTRYVWTIPPEHPIFCNY